MTIKLRQQSNISKTQQMACYQTYFVTEV